jgi:hypothetical protein
LRPLYFVGFSRLVADFLCASRMTPSLNQLFVAEQ